MEWPEFRNVKHELDDSARHVREAIHEIDAAAAWTGKISKTIRQSTAIRIGWPLPRDRRTAFWRQAATSNARKTTLPQEHGGTVRFTIWMKLSMPCIALPVMNGATSGCANRALNASWRR